MEYDRSVTNSQHCLYEGELTLHSEGGAALITDIHTD